MRPAKSPRAKSSPPGWRIPTSHDFQLSITTPVGRTHARQLRLRLRRSFAILHALRRPPLRDLSIAVVNDRTMCALHDRFMGLKTPTDVLTFELDHDHRGRVLAGEVIVCLDEAARQAKHRGHRVDDELLLYALHGMLHLCAFDDRSERGYTAMHRMEDHILETIGVGPIFAGRAKRPADTGGKRR